MLRLFVLSLFFASSVAFADTELTREEVLGVLKTLTAKKSRTWISSGVISAKHKEYKAPKIAEPDKLELEVQKSVDESTQKGIGAKQLEIVPFNTRYRLGNSYTLESEEFVRVNGDKFYWQIEISSRTDKVKPTLAEKTNPFIRYSLIKWNKLRVFAWDGEKYTKYFRPGNQAIITDDPSNPKGPLTVGCIPWGIGKWSYEEMEKCQLSGSRTENGEVILNIEGPVISRVVILNDLQDYTVKNFEFRVKPSEVVNSYSYDEYTKVSAGWVPKTVYITKSDNQRIISSDLWTDISVVENSLSTNDFVVDYDYNAFIEDFRFGSDVLRYKYTPAMEPEAMNIDTQDILKKKIDYLEQSSGKKTNCAIASVWLSCENMGKEISLEALRRLLPISKGQSSLADMINTFKVIGGMNVNAVKSNISEIAKLKDSQVILHIPGQDHFLNLLAVEGDKVHLADFNGRKFMYTVTRSKLEKIWGGVALLVSETDAVTARGFAKLGANEIAGISGAECQECNTLIQTGVDFGACYYLSPTCSGEVFQILERHGCGPSTTGECAMEYIASCQMTQCNFDIDFLCTPCGSALVYTEILACD